MTPREFMDAVAAERLLTDPRKLRPLNLLVQTTRYAVDQAIRVTNTRELLRQCWAAGYERVDVYSYNVDVAPVVFDPVDEPWRKHGWPSIWRIVRSMAGMSCGGTVNAQPEVSVFCSGHYDRDASARKQRAPFFLLVQ